MEPLASRSSIKLVVKTPNQRVKDIEVSCLLDWTVEKLKSHLSTVYPTKPARSSQKIIYSGKLLDDHFVLKDVIQESDGEHQTVHLVCMTSNTEIPAPKVATQVPTAPPTTSNVPMPTSTTTSAPNMATQTDGLRHRAQPYAQNPYYNTAFANNGTHFPISGQPNMNANASGHFMPAHVTTPYRNAQYFDAHNMHLMAAQHLAYMQWMQHVAQIMPGNVANMHGFATPPQMYYTQENVPQSPATNETPATAAVPPAQQAQERRENPQEQDPNMVMNANAGGGMMQEDEEEDNRQRDWLDIVYMFVRVCMLMSIFWFYSSFEKILGLGLIVFIIWLFQSGVLNLNRAQRNRQEVPMEDNDDNAGGERPEDEEDTEEGEVVEGDVGSDRESQGEDQTDNNTESNERNNPGYFVVAYNFLVTFFTSLIPQQPQAIPQP